MDETKRNQQNPTAPPETPATVSAAPMQPILATADDASRQAAATEDEDVFVLEMSPPEPPDNARELKRILEAVLLSTT